MNVKIFSANSLLCSATIRIKDKINADTIVVPINNNHVPKVIVDNLTIANAINPKIINEFNILPK